MLLIDTLLIGVIAIVALKEKTSNVEQAELVPIPVSDEEFKAQKAND